MDNFLNRLNRNPYQPIDAASITRVDELGNGYDDFGQMIQPKFQAPEQTWGETALGVATAPARIATALADSVSPYGSEGWRMPPIIDEGVNALSAVGDAYTQGMSEDEMRNRALGMASFMFAGGGPAVALEKSLTQKPVTVRGYHGTRSEFDKFNGPSVYASENPDAASEWAMVANRDGEAPNVLPLDITASNPYYAKSLFPDQAELDRIAAADPDVVFYPPSTQHGTTFDKYPGQVFEARKPGTVRSATTGETLFSNADSRPALLAYHGTNSDIRGTLKDVTESVNSTTFGDVQTTRYGPFLSDNPEFSREYGSNVIPAEVRADNVADVGAVRQDFVDSLDPFEQRDLWLSAKYAPNSWQMFEGERGKAFTDWLRSSGYDAARFFEEVPTQAGGYVEGNTIVPLQRGTVFRPDTGEQLYANADSRPALLGAGQEQDIPDWLLPYLR